MFKNLASIFLTFVGYVYFLIFKKTPNIFYQSYVRSYCFTNGLIRDVLCFFVILANHEKNDFKKEKSNILQDIDFKLVNEKIINNGYYKFDKLLDKNFLSKIKEFSENTNCIFYDDNGHKKKTFFNKYDSIFHSSKYSFEEEDIYNFKEINSIINDNSIIKICKNYFRSKVFFSQASMWWSPVRNSKNTIKTELANKSAQFYHFDLDRIKWLKFFIYLTDIDEYSGPHEYVSKTHLRFSKNQKILKKGYERIDNDLIIKNYDSNRINKILGPSGTIFVGDTSCFHRGSPPIDAHRLLLVLEFSNSLFGAKYNIIKSRQNNILNPNLISKYKIRLN